MEPLDFATIERIISSWTFPTVVLFLIVRWAAKMALWAKPFAEALIKAHHDTLAKLSNAADTSAAATAALHRLIEHNEILAVNRDDKLIARVAEAEQKILTAIGE